ncbi:MAG TPA: D-aminoacyl-tRNA deacylase [Polyangiales bacterium]|jgi:D-tyrosyl-tRNA(Tyr) deacylase
MRAVAQRVREAHVQVEAETVGRIGRGLLVYLGAGKRDGEREPAWMADKLAGLRVFEDEAGKMSRSVQDVEGEVLVVSQFTLYGDVRRGRRPSFDDAALPEAAERAYLTVCSELSARGLRVATGRFRANMQVHAVIDGPVTIMIDSEKVF